MPVTAVDENRWEKARLPMVVRWREILQRIRTREEGEVLRLLNGRWEATRCLAEAHLGRLETADFSDAGNRRVEEALRP